MAPTIASPLCKVFNIKYPIMLAGMGKVANSELCAAVCNAGGIGSMGGVFKTPEQVQKDIDDMKALLKDKNAPFGYDILLPSLSATARKTNYDYTKGKLGEIIDILIKEKVTLFICAVGVPPKEVVDKLHANGIIVANMVGATKHAKKALDLGVDIVICQGSEGGGHTGTVSTLTLVPEVVDLCKGRKSELIGDVLVVAAGGIADGRTMAAAFALGASGCWVGTRFVAAKESGATPYHQKLITDADTSGTMVSTVYTGRTMRIIKNEYAYDWETRRREEKEKLERQGIIAYGYDMDAAEKAGKDFDMIKTFPNLAGQCSGLIKEVLPAADIIENMMTECVQVMRTNASKL